MANLGMPLLCELINKGKYNEDVVVLHINHCMDNSFYFSEVLKQVFYDVIFVGIPYSAKTVPNNISLTAYHAYADAEGYHLCCNNNCISVLNTSFINATERLIELSIEKSIIDYVRTGKRILILEDGGYHYAVVRRMTALFPELASAIIGAVEQTTSGTRRANSCAAQSYPVMSVSRSKYKVRVESYFVANRVVDSLIFLLREMNCFLDFRNCLLLGYGIIGRSIANSLKGHNMTISVRDISVPVQDAAQSDGFSLWNGELYDNMLVIGSVGAPSFTAEMLDSFLSSPHRRIFLSSASSKQYEFEHILPILEKHPKHTIGYSTIYYPTSDKEIILIANGFPVNFVDNTQDSLTFDMIDPVFSELYLLMQYLLDNSAGLENRTYLLGYHDFDFEPISEKALIDRWCNLNTLSLDIDSFNVHPCESLLAKNILSEN